MGKMTTRNLKLLEGAAQTLGRAWGLSEPLRIIGDVENMVYEGRLGDRMAIFRLTEESHRAASQIQAELDWLKSLQDSGLPVCQVIPSESRTLIESEKFEDEHLHLCVFEKAEGEAFRVEKHWGEPFFKKMGELFGKLHLQSQSYRPTGAKRPRWRDLRHIDRGFEILPMSDEPAREEWKTLLNWMSELEVEEDSFGIVHGDLHHGNYFLTSPEEFTVFDFDDSCYSFYGFDLSIPFYYFKNLSIKEPKIKEEWNLFRDEFLNSYLKYYSLNQKWIDRIDSFVRFRNIEIYVWFHIMFDLNHPSKKQKEYIERTRAEMKTPIELK